MPLLLLLSPALAQEGFDAHGLHLAALDDDLRSPLVVPRAGAWAGGDAFAGAILEYAAAPLRWIPLDASGAPAGEVALLDDLVTLNVSSGFSLSDRLRLDLAAPVYLSATTPDGPLGGPLLGDLRGTAALALLRPEQADGAGLALTGWVDAPTGPDELGLGIAGYGGGAGITGTLAPGPATLTSSLGLGGRPALDDHNLPGGPALSFGIAGGLLLSPTVGATLELRSEIPLRAPDDPGPAAATEVLLSARTRSETGGHVLAGGAVAIGEAPGSARFRLFLGGGFGLHGGPRPPADPDHDGIVGEADACPDDPETRNGLADADGCPDEPARLLVTAAKEGRLVVGATLEGTDGQAVTTGVSDTRPWAIETWTGSRWSLTGRDGACWRGEATASPRAGDNPVVLSLLPAYDATLLVSVVDEGGAPLPEADLRWEGGPEGCAPEGIRHPGAFPVGAGTWRVTATAGDRHADSAWVEVAPGETRELRLVLQPARILIEPTRIRTMEPVNFDYDSVALTERSRAILADLAVALVAHPELGRVEVAGHTDAKGSDRYNQELSQRRVEAVRDYLVSRGVAASRLVPRGYGEIDPVDTNLTEAGRARNRRVEFILLDRAEPE